MLSHLPDTHATTLTRIIKALQRDERFDALIGAGSLVHGGMDEFSDLDLVLIVQPDAYQGVMSERQSIALHFGELLASFTGEHVGEPRLLICLYGPALIHVDLKFVQRNDLQPAPEQSQILWARTPGQIATTTEHAGLHGLDRSPQWFEDRAWIWLHYGATKWLRGELFEAIGMLGYLRENILGPMISRNRGLPQRGVRRIDKAADIRSALSKTVPCYESASVKDALINSIQLYLKLREVHRPPAQTASMPDALMAFIERPATLPLAKHPPTGP